MSAKKNSTILSYFSKKPSTSSQESTPKTPNYQGDNTKASSAVKKIVVNPIRYDDADDDDDDEEPTTAKKQETEAEELARLCVEDDDDDDMEQVNCFSINFPSPAGTNCPFLSSFLCHLLHK
jgi:hypothetical protein